MIKPLQQTNKSHQEKNEDGLTNEDSEAVKGSNKKFIDLLVIYHENAQVPWGEKPLEVGETSNVVATKDPSGQKGSTVKDRAQEASLNKFRDRLDDDEDGQQGSSKTSLNQKDHSKRL